MNKEICKTDKGITLVALIVTIIILVIIAAVSIKTIYDMNFVGVAIKGTEGYMEAQMNEMDTMESLAKYIEEAVRDITEGNGDEGDNPEGPTPTLPEVGETVPDEGWAVEVAKGLVERDGLKAHLGEKVAYNPTAGGVWRIFYYDDEDQGNGKGYFGDNLGTVYLKRDYDSGLVTQLGSYSGYMPTDDGAMMRQMNPKWASSSYSTIDLENEHCVSWLCDPSQWTSYKSEGVAKYAIGSPGVEMYMKAYNKYKSDDNALINKIGNAKGYSVGENGTYGGNAQKSEYYIAGILEPGPNNIFTPYGHPYYWLSSPSGASDKSLIYVWPTSSGLQNGGMDSKYGVCPVVSLL